MHVGHNKDTAKQPYSETTSVVKPLMSIFLKHAYVPKHILTDKNTVFTSYLMKQIMEITGIKFSHATIKNTQTIGKIEQSHAKLKEILKIIVNLKRLHWDIYVDLAIMAHNTTYHTSILCSPTEIFHGRTPYNAFDNQYQHPSKQVDTKDTEVNQILNKMNAAFRQNSANILNAFHKYRTYHDGKTWAHLNLNKATKTRFLERTKPF